MEDFVLQAINELCTAPVSESERVCDKYRTLLQEWNWSSSNSTVVEPIGNKLFLALGTARNCEKSSLLQSIFCKIYPLLSVDLQQKAFSKALKALNPENYNDLDAFSPLVSISLLATALQHHICFEEESLLDSLNEALLHGSDIQCVQIIHAIFKPLSCLIGDVSVEAFSCSILRTLINEFMFCCTEKFLFLLCVMLPHFNSSHLNHSTHFAGKLEFWQQIQTGFYHESRLCRKRSIFIVKCVLEACQNQKEDFQCSPVFVWKHERKEEIIEIWNNFFLVIESLEEKQV